MVRGAFLLPAPCSLLRGWDRPGTYIPQTGKLSGLSFANQVLASRFWVITEAVYITARDASPQISLRARPHS